MHQFLNVVGKPDELTDDKKQDAERPTGWTGCRRQVQLHMQDADSVRALPHSERA